jgi:hypothetical protein
MEDSAEKCNVPPEEAAPTGITAAEAFAQDVP